MKYKLNKFLKSDYFEDGKYNIQSVDIIAFAVIISLGIIARMAFLEIRSADYNSFLVHWFSELKEFGGLSAIGRSVGNYTPPYIYLMSILTYIPISGLFSIKLLSMIFDLLLAVAMFIFVFREKKDFVSAMMAFAAVFLAPTVVLNSSAWAQCDGIYSFFVLLSLFAFIREKPNAAMIFFSVALCFKLQAIFFLPVIALFYFNEKLKLRHFLWVPCCYFISILPAWIMGRPLKELLTVYIGQAGTNKAMSLNCPNFYSVVSSSKDSSLSFAGIILCMAVIFVAIYLIYKSGVKLDRDLMITVSLFFTLVMPFFLPHMHERYFYIAEIFSIVYAFTMKKRRWIPILVITPAMFTYVWYLFRQSYFKAPVLAFLTLGAIVVVGYDLVQQIKEKKQNRELL